MVIKVTVFIGEMIPEDMMVPGYSNIWRSDFLAILSQADSSGLFSGLIGSWVVKSSLAFIPGWIPDLEGDEEESNLNPGHSELEATRHQVHGGEVAEGLNGELSFVEITIRLGGPMIAKKPASRTSVKRDPQILKP